MRGRRIESWDTAHGRRAASAPATRTRSYPSTIGYARRRLSLATLRTRLDAQRCAPIPVGVNARPAIVAGNLLGTTPTLGNRENEPCRCRRTAEAGRQT